METITQSSATLTYAYDDAGNITSVSDGSKTISYEYDLLGQLIRANDPYDTTAGTTGTTWKYAYDLGGNIQSKTAYAFTTGTVGSAVKTDSYTYGDANWKDKLTAFNGTTITYDAIGNPINGGTWNYTWNGRQMRATHKGNFGEPGYDEITYDYNEDGLRTKKTRMYYDNATGDIGYKVTNYTLHGKNIVHMSDGSNSLHFFYDAQNKPAVVIFNGTAYAYLYNLQGDVIGLVDSNGTKMVSYSYDAWGKMISKTGSLASTLGTIQPFRYRGYVFDEETGLYYLRSRYYSSTIQRFISSDLVVGFVGQLFTHNQYTYCENNPINYVDRNGLSHWFDLKWGYSYRIDYGPDSVHIHIRYKNSPIEWKQKLNGEPYEPNHRTTRSDEPPKRVRDLLKKIKDKNDKNNKSGGSGGPGWDWDGNKATADDESNKGNQSEFHIEDAVQTGIGIMAVGGIGYGLYRVIRLIPSFAPPLWWTLPANIAIP